MKESPYFSPAMGKVVRVDRESLAYSDPWTRRTE